MKNSKTKKAAVGAAKKPSASAVKKSAPQAAPRAAKRAPLKQTAVEDTPERKPRADAQRNRERILAVAKEAFARSGAEPSMDEVARLAKVGPGTLYRNFPSRDALLEALYRSEVERLAVSARELSAKLEPVAALRAWLLLLVDYMAAKRLYMPALQTMVCGTTDVFAATGEVLIGSMDMLTSRAVTAGGIRKDIVPMDLMLAMFGVAYAGPNKEWQERARRMVDVLLIGARP